MPSFFSTILSIFRIIIIFQIFTIFLRFSASENAASCDGFGWTKWNENCYKLFTFELNFTGANQLCQKFGARSVSILDNAENDLAKALIHDGFVDKLGIGQESGRENGLIGIWIGLKRGENGSNAFKWMDGEKAFAAEWRKLENNNLNENGQENNAKKDCVEMLVNNGVWREIDCDSLLSGVICKQKPVADLEEGISYKNLLDQTSTGEKIVEISKAEKDDILQKENEMVKKLNARNKQWKATVYETFALMPTEGKQFLLGVKQFNEEEENGREKRQTLYAGHPSMYYFPQYPNYNAMYAPQQYAQYATLYAQQLYAQYAAQYQQQYAQQYFQKQQEQQRSATPTHMQQLYQQAFAQYDQRNLQSALQGYLTYIGLSYQQPLSQFPRQYDLREAFPQCARWIGLARDQGKCGSCWAVATAAARDDRACIFLRLRNNYVFNHPNMYSSEMDVISCAKGAKGCDGGTPKLAWNHIKLNGFFSGEPFVNGTGCKPYVFPPVKQDPERMRKAPPCTDRCQAEWKRMAWDKASGRMETPAGGNETRYRTVILTNHWGMDGVKNANKQQQNGQQMLEASERGIMAEIYYFGSVVASINIYEDFFRYERGVYKHTMGKLLGGHAIKLIGWGEEQKGREGEPKKRYWIGVNSWNSWWGENGTFRIERGTNQSGVEWKALDVGYIFF